jgi:hypothetical protein
MLSKNKKNIDEQQKMPRNTTAPDPERQLMIKAKICQRCVLCVRPVWLHAAQGAAVMIEISLNARNSRWSSVVRLLQRVLCVRSGSSVNCIPLAPAAKVDSSQ